MEAPSLQLTANPPRSHWTLSVSREETLAIREKFRKVDWRKPNHKLKTTKVIARVKKIWDRYVALDDLFHRRDDSVRVSDGVFSDIASISVSISIKPF